MEKQVLPVQQTRNEFLLSIGFNKYMCRKAIIILNKEDITDVPSLLDLSDIELIEIGFSLGMRKQLRQYLSVNITIEDLNAKQQKLKSYDRLLKEKIQQFEKVKGQQEILLKEYSLKTNKIQKQLDETKSNLVQSSCLQRKVSEFLQMPAMMLLSRSTIMEEVLTDCAKTVNVNTLKTWSVPKFLPEYCGSMIELSKDNRIAIGKSKFRWYASALGTATSKFTILLWTDPGYLMIGFAQNNINKEATNFSSNGFYICTYNGSLFSEDDISCKKYGKSIQKGSTVTGHWKADSGEISFAVNGHNFGCAFTTNKKNLHPAFCFCSQTQIEFTQEKNIYFTTDCT